MTIDPNEETDIIMEYEREATPFEVEIFERENPE